MADDIEMTPVTDEPPKANPMAPGSGAATTLKLKPVIRKAADPAASAPADNPAAPKVPASPVAPVSPAAAKPAASALRPGLKLPPRPAIGGAGGLKPGLKLPPKPTIGGAGGLKPGLKLPPKPVIRKPGTAAASPLVKPVPEKPVAASGAAAEGKPEAPATGAKPIPNAMDVLKSVTQKLKGMTQPVSTPQQAVLHKTGIIADSVASTEAQKQAARAKTSRISLSDAAGVAPVKEEQVQAKTIRIKRADPAGPAPAAPVPPPAAEQPKAQDPSLTQRKTLKISRPGAAGGAAPAVKPATPAKPRFTIKKPGAPKPPEAAAPADGEVADIPDLPEVPATGSPAPVAAVPVAGERDVPKALAVVDLVLQVAACGAIGFLGWLLYQDWMLPLVAGGCQ